MFEPVSNKAEFAAHEAIVLDFWERRGIFRQSLEARKNATPFVFYDGPPFATGLPHYGHLLAGTIKDIIPRYQTMRGRYVERRFGWDCHGLPIEAIAQEALALNGTADIRRFGIGAFNEKCRSLVMTYVNEWRKTVTRMGRWVDFDNDYKTMDPEFMETVWWVFKQLWDQGRIYKSYRIMPYSWKLTTPLSNFEAGSNYKEIQDPSVTLRVRVLSGLPDWKTEAYLLIWTTTPWTLPSNLAVCAGPGIDYVAVRDASDGCVYLLAESRLPSYYKDAEQFETMGRFKGRELAGIRYEPIFPYFKDRPNAFRVLCDAFVTAEDGAGLVHLAPAYGEDDFRVCRDERIELVDPLDESCAFTDAVPEVAGLFCKEADKTLLKLLKESGKLVHHGTLVHSYPFCERTDTPLVYRAIEAWFVRVEDRREDFARANETVRWMPDHIGDKRFGNWLREARDWNISRNRFWGSCIPVWVSEDREDMICIGSIEELERLSGHRVTDLHKHIIDEVTFVRNGKRYRRTPEVLDCWFESGSMPLAQQHYPFDSNRALDQFFPADFIAEGLDQTRGWFYTLLVLSTLLFNRSSYRNVVVNGLVLAEDGRKMSKRLKNYPDPTYMIDTYGADALRLYLINSPVVRADDLRFSEDGVLHLTRHILIPWWNAYAFFVTYANIDGWMPASATDNTSENVLDRWILSSLETLIERVTSSMDGYDLQNSVRPFVHFIEDLTNWYIRRSRRRFWKTQDDRDKRQAYETLHEVLLRLSMIAAPFVPFISETIYRNLRSENMPESVHLCDFPRVRDARRDPVLDAEMEVAMSVVRMGRLLRSEHELKVRQPLSTLHVVSRNADKLRQVEALSDLIQDELNVKSLRSSGNEHELATLKAKADFKRLGPRLGKDVRAAAGAIEALGPAALSSLAEGREIRVRVDNSDIAIGPEDVVLFRIPREGVVVATDADLIVALETQLNDELLLEGLAREFVNKVQNLRKSVELEVTQRIRLSVCGDEMFREAMRVHGDYACAETLCSELRWVEHGESHGVEMTLNEHVIRIAMDPVESHE